MKFTLIRFCGLHIERILAAGLLVMLGLPVCAATTYTFPGNLPAGCTGNNGSYTCNFLSLNYQDAIVIASPKPATITVKGDFSTNQNKINVGGSASDLQFIVNGTLNLNWNSTLNANVSASEVKGDSSVAFGGNIAATGDVILSDSSHVSGTITSTSGQVQLKNDVTVDGSVVSAKDVTVKYQAHVVGSITSMSGQVQLENNVTVDGNVVSAKDVTIKYQAHVVGSVTSISGQVQLEQEAMVGSITTGGDGKVAVKYAGVVCGDITTKTGDVTVEQNGKIGGNIKSSTGDITLGYQAHVRGSVSTSGKIKRDSTSTVNETGLIMPAACSVSPPGGTASGFNAIDEAYSQVLDNFLNGRIFMKVAGKAFKLSIAALDNKLIVAGYAAGGNKDATVRLVDNSDGACVLDSAQSNYCNAACKAKTTVASQTVTFTSADKGIKQTANFTINGAYKKLAAIIGDGTVTACAIDTFAVRPSAMTATTTASNVNATGTPKLKAGTDVFAIAATANAGGYSGIPVIDSSSFASVIPAATDGGVAGIVSGDFPAATPGTSSSESRGDAFKYSEVGVFSIAKYGIYDGTWTAVDSVDGDCIIGGFSNEKDANGKYGCNFGSDGELTLGRFIPDHFTLVGGVVMPACSAGAAPFTYMSQPLGVLQFTVQAQNGGGGITQNYAGALAIGAVAMVAENNNAGTDLGGRLLISGTAPSWVKGEFKLDSIDSRFVRAAAPDGPYDALQIGVRVTDADGPVLDGRNMNAGTAGACDVANDCDSKQIGGATRVRFGRLRLTNAYGSEKLTLPIPMRAEYYNGTTFVKNSLDNCTSVVAANMAMPGYSGGVNAGNMSLANNVVAGGTFAAGTGRLTLARPNPAAIRKGSVDVCVDLGADVPVTPARCVAVTPLARPWLKGRWTGGGYDDDPMSRATFGVYKSSLGRGSEMIYFREMY